jgi:hypothetical protein
MNDDTEIVPETCSSGISSASKSQELLWRENVSEREMSCDEIAYKVNNLRRENELNTLYVDGLALEHGISRFVDKLREKRRGISKPSELGFRWSFKHNRNIKVAGFGSRPGFAQSRRVTIFFNRDELMAACGLRDTNTITLLDWVHIIKNKLTGQSQDSPSATLVDACTPCVLIDRLKQIGSSLSSSEAIKSSSMEVQTDDQNEEENWEKFMSSLKEKLSAELVALKEAVKADHLTLKSLTQDDEYMNHLHDALWNACIRDAGAAETWFQLFFWGSVSPKEKKIFNIVGNPDYIKELKKGMMLSKDDLRNKLADDSGNSILVKS